MDQLPEIDWEDVARRYPVGTIVEGVVTKQVLFGVFLDIGHPYIPGLVRIVDFPEDGLITARQFPPLRSRVRGVVLGISSQQVVIGMKPAQLALAIGQF